MILHFVSDEKFIDGFIENQQKYCPDIENLYIAVADRPLRYIKNQSVIHVSSKNTFSSLSHIWKNPPSSIVFHSLTGSKVDLVLSIPRNIEVVWIFYGSEVYDRLENVDRFLGEKTREFAQKNPFFRFKSVLRKAQLNLGNTITNFIHFRIWKFSRVLARINYMAHWITEDYDFVSKRYKLDNLKFLEFGYLSASASLDNINESKKTNLMIGNSGSITNNHLDIIATLSDRFVRQFDRIIIPLSYSGKDSYTRVVEETAINRFGSKVQVLKTFMSKDEYYDLISTVKLAIMGHLRPQGGGNIRFFLENKIDLAMYETNSINKLFSNNGAKIHRISDLGRDKFTFLSSEELNNNCSVQKKLYNAAKGAEFYTRLLGRHKL